MHGRTLRRATDVVMPDLIERTLGGPAAGQPIRVCGGSGAGPLNPARRAELALDELERTAAFDRSHLLLVSPAGTGRADQALIESAELLTRGDIATCAACAVCCYRYPLLLRARQLATGRQQFRALLAGLSQRLSGRPAQRRPRVLVFGAGLGAWASADICLRGGIAGLDGYGVDRALWTGPPALAAWSKTCMNSGRDPLTPAGTVRHFDRHERIAALTPEQRGSLRVVVVGHGNDQVGGMFPRLAGARPGYRAGTAQLAHAAFALPPVADEQMRAAAHAVAKRALDRTARLRPRGVWPAAIMSPMGPAG